MMIPEELQLDKNRRKSARGGLCRMHRAMPPTNDYSGAR